MFLVEDAILVAVVPDWPWEEGAYPKCLGMLGD